MKVVYNFNGGTHTSELIYFEKDGVIYENKKGERLVADHYQVEHGNEGPIDLFGNDIIRVIWEPEF